MHTCIYTYIFTYIQACLRCLYRYMTIVGTFNAPARMIASLPKPEWRVTIIVAPAATYACLQSAICLSVYLPIDTYLCIYLSIYRSIDRSIIYHLSIYVCIYRFINLSVYPSISIYLSICLSFYTYVHTCVHACIHTYIHTCVYFLLYIHMYTHVCLQQSWGSLLRRLTGLPQVRKFCGPPPSQQCSGGPQSLAERPEDLERAARDHAQAIVKPHDLTPFESMFGGVVAMIP